MYFFGFDELFFLAYEKGRWYLTFKIILDQNSDGSFQTSASLKTTKTVNDRIAPIVGSLGMLCFELFCPQWINEKLIFNYAMIQSNNLLILLLEVVCKSTNWKKEKCFKKAEVGSFSSFIQAGDPCFLHDDGKWVVLNIIIKKLN